MARGFFGMAIAAAVAMGAAGLGTAHGQDLPQPTPGTSGDFVASVNDTVYFGFDQDTLTAEAQAILDQQAEWLRQYPQATVDLAGHTDAVGSNTYNQDLGMRRADRVRDYLISQGIDAGRLTSVLSFGEERLAIETTSRELLNRRVVSVITSGTPVAAPAPLCPAPGSSDLAQIDSFSTLRQQLIAYVNDALQVQADFRGAWREQVAEIDLHAELTQVSCSIAYGYAGTGTYAERYIDDCACYHATLVSQLAY